MKDATRSDDVSANVRAVLARQRVTYRELARRLAERPDSDLAEEPLRRRIIGEVKFRADELPAIAAALGVPMSVLLGEQVAS